MSDYSGWADLQNAARIANAGTIHCHIYNLLCNTRFIRIVTVMLLKTMMAISASISLFTTGGFTMSVNTHTAARLTNHIDHCHADTPIVSSMWTKV